ncbi:putative toxin-antitoxin system toxin component, PIN family [Candidatus Daviesbacteria bacterium RIFCSPLOWO2_02_FULL_36_7]|uniref:Putative toxin-antitoxin system toxin component, PIN family n=1 Tax=Candidatus Daviesbacteria bacterium RIFCSPLOWO2_02_FULL_36_7 TaxID=1797792 RepID=A0A1F5MI22_9BACT|nr:MAG: putative toxin-antitoxin system toxin component, PIN family [Candidatus Daviesbacteria bacterium RIFCSPLOWO2_02_FULL_36_7]
MAVDTNLIISATLIPQSLPDRLIKLWLRDLFDLLISKEQLGEIKDTAKKEKLKNYPLFLNRIMEFIQNLEFSAELVKPIPEADLPIHSRDAKDNYLLATALEGGADYLVTGDEDLLVLQTNPSLGKLQIVTVKEFLSKLKS